MLYSKCMDAGYALMNGWSLISAFFAPSLRAFLLQLLLQPASIKLALDCEDINGRTSNLAGYEVESAEGGEST